MRVGLFGGTFDPVHHGHIHLCLELQQACQLSDIWVVPTSISPLRTHAPPIAFHHRLEMTQLAFQHLPFVHVMDWDQLAPCYTINIVKHALTLTEELYLLLGEDCLETLAQWHDIDTLLHLTKVCIGTRTHQKLHIPKKFKKIVEESLVCIPQLDISSSWIRKKLQSKAYVRHLVPQEVLDYIQTHNLY